MAEFLCYPFFPISVIGKKNLLSYQNFTYKQYKSLKVLISSLSFNFRINKNNILGHSEIAPDRKIDPGEKFNWDLIR